MIAIPKLLISHASPDHARATAKTTGFRTGSGQTGLSRKGHKFLKRLARHCLSGIRCHEEEAHREMLRSAWRLGFRGCAATSRRFIASRPSAPTQAVKFLTCCNILLHVRVGSRLALELFELFVLLKVDNRLSFERFGPTVSPSTVPTPLLNIL